MEGRYKKMGERNPSWSEWLADVGVFECKDGEWVFVKANELMPDSICELLSIPKITE